MRADVGDGAEPTENPMHAAPEDAVEFDTDAFKIGLDEDEDDIEAIEYLDARPRPERLGRRRVPTRYS